MLSQEAWAAWNRGSPADVARAKDLAQRALALDDRSVLAWKTIASWHLRARISQTIPTEGAIAGAEAAAQRAMEIDPEHPLVHTVYDAALVLRGRFEEGQKALEHEIATNPSHPVAYYYLGLSHLMMGEPKRAISLYERAIAISPRDARMSRSSATWPWRTFTMATCPQRSGMPGWQPRRPRSTGQHGPCFLRCVPSRATRPVQMLHQQS